MEIPADRTYAMTEALFFSPEPIVRRVYLAYVEGVDTPVATAGMLYMPDQPIALLLSSATLPDFRGYGIYTSLTARRLADPRQDGIEAAVIQAVRTTSAPICRKLGFVEIAPLEMYVGYAENEGWSEDESEAEVVTTNTQRDVQPMLAGVNAVNAGFQLRGNDTANLSFYEFLGDARCVISTSDTTTP